MAEKKPKEENQEVVHTINRKSSKSPWTVERCQKASKRFDNVDAWKKGAPSSFKAATAHGWLDQCTAHMQSARTLKRSA